MQDKPLISIIVLNYNAGKFLLNCIESIYKTNYDNFEIIIVDNNSIDNSHHICKKKYQDIILIENSKNLGFSEGNNIGIQKAKGEFLVILNPDTIVTENWLTELMTAYKINGEGLYQPKILSLDNRDEIQGTGVIIHLFGFGFTRDREFKDKNQYEKIEKIACPSGACMFLSAKTIKKIGLFDPFLFLYLDDLEFGWRAAQMGIDSFFVPKSTIYHAESPNLKWSSKKFFWLERNRKYCLKTHYSHNTYKKMAFSLFCTDILIWIFYISKGFIMSKIKAELDIIKNRDLIKRKYNEIEKKKIISDTEIIKMFSDTVFVPKSVASSKINTLFNYMISFLSTRARKNIQKS